MHDSKTAPRFIKYNLMHTMHQQDSLSLSLSVFWVAHLLNLKDSSEHLPASTERSSTKTPSILEVKVGFEGCLLHPPTPGCSAGSRGLRDIPRPLTINCKFFCIIATGNPPRTLSPKAYWHTCASLRPLTWCPQASNKSFELLV